MLRVDYQPMLTIARDVLMSGIYHLYSERRSYRFDDNAVELLQEIVAIGCELQFTEVYTTSFFELLFNVLGLGETPESIENISFAADEDALVSLVRPVAEVWNKTEGLHIAIRHFADKELFENVHESS